MATPGFQVSNVCLVEKVSGVDQLSAPACYEKWKYVLGSSRLWDQTDSEDDQTGQSKIGDPRQQLPCWLKLVSITTVASLQCELGTACRKYYRVCTLAIIDPGDSDIIRSMPEQTGEK